MKALLAQSFFLARSVFATFLLVLDHLVAPAAKKLALLRFGQRRACSQANIQLLDRRDLMGVVHEGKCRNEVSGCLELDSVHFDPDSVATASSDAQHVPERPTPANENGATFNCQPRDQVRHDAVWLFMQIDHFPMHVSLAVRWGGANKKVRTLLRVPVPCDVGPVKLPSCCT